jgi:DNA-binding transcriptional LysR family regulator
MSRLDEIATFLQIADTNSFNRAADQLGISVSMASRRLRALEQRLRTQLVVRNTRSLYLTEAGSAFRERAAKILSELDDAEGDTIAEGKGARGVLRLTMPLSFGALFIGPLIAEFAAANPDLSVEAHLSDELESLIADGFDMAIRIGELRDSSLVARRLCKMRFALCASPAYWRRYGKPRRPEDLGKHRALVHSHVKGPPRWEIPDENGKVNLVGVNARVRSNSGEYLRDAAIRGLGVCFEPTFVVHEALRSGRLEAVLICEMPQGVDAFVVYPQARHLPRRARLLIDFFAERFSGAPSWDMGLESRWLPAPTRRKKLGR